MYSFYDKTAKLKKVAMNFDNHLKNNKHSLHCYILFTSCKKCHRFSLKLEVFINIILYILLRNIYILLLFVPK